MALVTVATEDGDLVLSLQVSAQNLPPGTGVDDALSEVRTAILEALAREDDDGAAEALDGQHPAGGASA